MESVSTKDSPAVRLICMVWEHAQQATGHSWLKLNHALADTLGLAIRSGMKFEIDDFNTIRERFNSGYWIGDGEWIYNLAVLYRNSSAYLAYESHRSRKPFIVKSATIDTHTGDGPCGRGLARLVIGARFRWAGEEVRVTSFNDDRQTFTACSYKLDGESKNCAKCKSRISWPREVVKSRYTISHADIRRTKQTGVEPVATEGAA